MRYFWMLAPFVSALLAAGCDNEAKTPPPPPFTLTTEAIGHYCGMNLLEHPGPKGQIILEAKVGEPVWFSSARDAIAFTMLPEESKDIAAIYVSDMGNAPSWKAPGITNWIDARKAYFVIGSALRSGMGAEEAVPFSSPDAATEFAVKNGGKVVKFGDVPQNYILGGDDAGNADAPVADEDKAKELNHG